MNNSIDFDKISSGMIAETRKSRKEPKTLKVFIQEYIKEIEFYVTEVLNDEFFNNPYRIYAWDILDDIPRIKEQLLKEAWFQDIEKNNELYWNDKTDELDYENIHKRIENEYKIAIDGSINIFLSYLKLYPQIKKIIVEVEVEDLKNGKETREMDKLQIKIDSFVKNKREEILNE